MSCSTLYTLYKKTTREVAEFRNGWGTGPMCWDFLVEKYHPDKNFTNFDRPDYIGFDRKWKMAWELANDKRLLRCEHVAMRLTFDGAYVVHEDLKEVGLLCQDFFKEVCKDVKQLGKVNHFMVIGLELVRQSETRKRPHQRGIVLNCTSVNDVWIQPSRATLDKAWDIMKSFREQEAEWAAEEAA